MISKYLHLLCIIFILFEINIIKVIATSSDCEHFKNIIPYLHNDDFEKQFKKELNCCFLNYIFLTCDERNENIVSVELMGKEVSHFETIFEEFKSFNNLTSLTISNSELSDIPDNIVVLKNLRSLAITDSKLTSIPKSLKTLSNLKNLNLSNNKIEGEIPEIIIEMTSLETLFLSGNKLSGTIPKELKNLKKLTSLDLGRNKLEGYFPYDLVELENLKYLYLESNEKLDGYIPPYPNIDNCNYRETELCSLKDEKCEAPVRCYKEEIEDANKHNGIPDPNKNVDRAITDKNQRNVSGGGGKVLTWGLPSTIVIILVLLCIGAGSNDEKGTLVREYYI